MKLAILIVGVQNSGKTSTIKHLVNTYSNKSLTIMRAGWAHLFLNVIFKSLRLTAYCIPASPTETGKDLSLRFQVWDAINIPQTLIIAEQLNGSKFNNTMIFLNSNGYHILRYDLSNNNGTSIWDRFNKSNEKSILDKRATKIIDDIKTFIRPII